MTSRRWQWEWGGRGGVAAGLISAIMLTYLFRDLGALIFIPVAAFLLYLVVREWPTQSHQDRLVRRRVLFGIICVAVILVVAFPVRSLTETAWQAKETRRAKEIVGKLIDTGNEVDGRWTRGLQTQDGALRKKGEDDINTWRGIAGAGLSKCPFQENVWLHDVATQNYNLIALEIARLHTVRDHISDFLEPKCFTIWQRSRERGS